MPRKTVAVSLPPEIHADVEYLAGVAQVTVSGWCYAAVLEAVRRKMVKAKQRGRGLASADERTRAQVSAAGHAALNRKSEKLS